MLYLVPTPVGNLKDITLRALDILREADGILAEDTRTTGNLLKHYGISNKLYSFHLNNEHRVLQSVMDRLAAGETLALVSDAGTPGISDPGFLLVRECIRQGIKTECLPGATAFVPALVNSGFPCDRFVFEGFLPPKKGRQTRLGELASETRTIILYEAPHRLVKTLAELQQHFGKERQAMVARELTKMYEENRHGTLEELHQHFESKGAKGEIVIIINGVNARHTHEE